MATEESRKADKKVVEESNKVRRRLEQSVEQRDAVVAVQNKNIGWLQRELVDKEMELKKLAEKLALKEKQLLSFEQELKSLRDAAKEGKVVGIGGEDK